MRKVIVKKEFSNLRGVGNRTTLLFENGLVIPFETPEDAEQVLSYFDKDFVEIIHEETCSHSAFTMNNSFRMGDYDLVCVVCKKSFTLTVVELQELIKGKVNQ